MMMEDKNKKLLYTEGKENSIIVEYTQLCENMRHYGNQRYAALTFFLTSNALLLSKFYFNNTNQILISVAGFILTSVFWILEERAADFYHHFKRCAIEIENKFGLKQFSSPVRKPKLGVLTATNAVRLLYGALFVHWIIWIIWLVLI